MRSNASIGQNILGFRGGKGTSHPHFTIAPKIPAKIPIKNARVYFLSVFIVSPFFGFDYN